MGWPHNPFFRRPLANLEPCERCPCGGLIARRGPRERCGCCRRLSHQECLRNRGASAVCPACEPVPIEAEELPAPLMQPINDAQLWGRITPSHETTARLIFALSAEFFLRF